MNVSALNVLSFRPIDDLEAALVESCRDVSRATHRFLVLLREFDLRQGWKTYGNVDCAEWLNWRCGIARVTAQEKVRIARACSGSLTVELPRAELELVLRALEFVGGTLPDDPSRSLFAKGADALLQMARDALAGQMDGPSASDAYQVVVHVDATALSGTGGRSDVPLPTVRRLCCDGSVVPIFDGEDGQALNVGRKQRVVTTPLKRAVFARDRSCTFPGCHHERYLDLHHIEHWADGGETSLANLLVLCSAHHRLVHEGGFRIESHRDGRYYFVRPDGRPVEAPTSASSNCVEETRAAYRVVPHSAEYGLGHFANVARAHPSSAVGIPFGVEYDRP